MKLKKAEVKKQSKTRAKEQRETEYESFGISLGRERVCVNSKYHRERERQVRAFENVRCGEEG